MAKPEIFVSSTWYDLKEIREDIANFIEGFGYEPIIHERYEIFYDPNKHTHVSCIDRVKSVDMVVFIIGGRFGEKAVDQTYANIDFEKINLNKSFLNNIKDGEYSVTQVEVFTAILNNIPVYTLVHHDVYSDYRTYFLNKDNSGLKEITFASIEKPGTGPQIFEFIKLIENREQGNIVQKWNNLSDIKAFLTNQWASIFKTSLAQFRVINEVDKYVHATIVNHISFERRKSFSDLFRDVDKGDEIRILGTGATNFLKRTEDVETYLENNNHICILLINDQLVKSDWACSSQIFLDKVNDVLKSRNLNIISELEAKTICPLADYNILVDKNHFNNYYSREDYIDEVRESYGLINDFRKKIKKESWTGTLEVKHFYSFVPMSITAIFPNDSLNRKLIAEFVIPFTKKRILLRSSLDENREIYDLFINFFSETWKRAIPI